MSTCIAIPERSSTVDPRHTGELTHSSRWIWWPGLRPMPKNGSPSRRSMIAWRAPPVWPTWSALVPLGDRLEVRRDQPLDVVRAPRPAAPSASSTTNPARQLSAPHTPNATVIGSPASIRRSPGLSSPSAARGPAVSIRWHESGIPFQFRSLTASASVIPGRRPVQQAPHPVGRLARRVLEHRELVHVVDDPQPVRGVHQQVVRVLDEAGDPGQAAERVRDVRRAPRAASGRRTASSRSRRPGCRARSPPPPGCRRAAATGRAAASAG